jgi:aerobic carbon-monoxide dehydrogenase small subunit
VSYLEVMMEIKFNLNGKQVCLEAEPGMRLVDLLRGKLNLTGTKEGCGVGECGACTVLMNGRAVNSCLVLAAQVNGTAIITIEGISNDAELHPLQKNILEHGAIQCGFCTPGMVLSVYALLEENKNPTEEEIKDAIAGNLCRCTGYKQIIEAVKTAAKEIHNK